MNNIKTYSYNLHIAEIFGIHSAVLINCIIDERDYQRRIKHNNENIIALSFDEIYARTALSADKLTDVEQALIECGVLSIKPFQKIKNKNYYILNEAQLNKIITAVLPQNEILQAVPIAFNKDSNTKHVKTTTKRDMHIASLKKSIDIEDPIIQQYLCDWIDSVYSNPKGFLSISSVKISITDLFNYTNNDQNKQIEILQIAIKGGMRDLTWAITQYEKLNNSKISNNFVVYNDIKSNGKNTVDEAF